jgi:hypothetical protein
VWCVPGCGGGCGGLDWGEGQSVLGRVGLALSEAGSDESRYASGSYGAVALRRGICWAQELFLQFDGHSLLVLVVDDGGRRSEVPRCSGF